MPNCSRRAHLFRNIIPTSHNRDTESAWITGPTLFTSIKQTVRVYNLKDWRLLIPTQRKKSYLERTNESGIFQFTCSPDKTFVLLVCTELLTGFSWLKVLKNLKSTPHYQTSLYYVILQLVLDQQKAVTITRNYYTKYTLFNFPAYIPPFPFFLREILQQTVLSERRDCMRLKQLPSVWLQKCSPVLKFL